MTQSEIIYHNVQESFGMGGPYLGELEFKGQLVHGTFLADGECLSKDRSKMVFSQFTTVPIRRVLWTKTV